MIRLPVSFRLALASLLALTLHAALMAQDPEPEPEPGRIAIVVHGGAGALARGRYTPEQEQAYRAKLEEATEAGYAVLESGGTSEAAVVAAIVILEDSPLFNAGKGAVYTSEGAAELDASIMRGSDLNAGAVAGVRRVKNPIKAARAVMNESDHVLLAREGAEEFAESRGVETVDTAYFYLEKRAEQLRRIQERERDQGDASPRLLEDLDAPENPDRKFGTVGCVALDKAGNLCAATSTGGMMNKKYGRIGDSPIIGAGTYADNATCGVSCTGHGEYFIRMAVAYDVAALMRYGGHSLHEAARVVVMEKLPAIGGDGGLVALDAQGNVVMEFNTSGMFRAFRKWDGSKGVAIYGDEKINR